MSTPLYELLPGIYRELDEQGSGALQALLKVVEGVRSDLDRDTAGLYENWFVETCDEEALRRIASLVGIDPHLARRAAVGNAIAVRRRKGTFAALERALFDASGWIASTALAATEPDQPIKVSISTWRQPVFEVIGATPYRLGSGIYTFHTMGITMPLFHMAEPNYTMEATCTPTNLPFRLDIDTPLSQTGNLAITLIAGDHRKAIPYQFGDLSGPALPQPSPHDPPLRAIIDPAKGLFYLTPEPKPLTSGATDPSALEVSYAYAFSSHLGNTPMPHITPGTTDTEWLAYVHHAAPLEGRPPWLFTAVQDALDAFSKTTSSGTIRILDSVTYALGDYTLQNPTCGHPSGVRADLTLEALAGQAPCLAGSLRVAPSPPGLNLQLHNLSLTGAIYASGDLTLTVRHGTIRPQHNPAVLPGAAPSRLKPPVLGIQSPSGAQPNLRIILESSICGPVRLPADCPGLTASDSILESFAAPPQPNQKDDLPGAPCHLIRSSVLGSFKSTQIIAENSIYPPYVLPGSSPFLPARYGSPDYARLRPDASSIYLEGASNGSEQGAFNGAEQPRRTQQFDAALADFMPVDIAYEIDWKT